MWVVKPSKKVVYNDCRIVDKAVFVPMTNQTLAEPGGAICMIEFVSGEDVVSSFSFNLYVYESASGDGIPSENESTVLEGMFEELAQDAIKTLNEAKAQAAAAKKSAQDTEKIKNDFTLTAQQAVADVNNAGQTQTQRVNTAGDTQVSRIQAEGTTQVQNVQATAAEIAADRNQIHTNRDNTARLQRTTAGAITRSAEGSFITLEDAADGMGFRQLEIPGMTEQVTTTGAQMIDFEQCLKNWKSQYTQVGGRVYKITAIGTGYQAPVAFSESDIKVTLSGIIRDLSGSGYRVDLIDSSGNIVGRINKDIKSITGLASKIRLNFAEAVAGEYSDIMLNAGSAALPWEPYTGSKPSPSPEYPQELENVGRLNKDGKYEVKVHSSGAQLLKLSDVANATRNGMTYSIHNSVVTVNGTPSAAYASIVSGQLTLLPGTYYVAGGETSPGHVGLQINVTKANGEVNFCRNQAFTIDGTERNIAFAIQCSSDLSPINNYTLYPMLNAGDTPLPCVPYRASTATITSDRPLTKWDKLTCRDGVWGWAYGGATVIEDGSQDMDNTWYPSIVLSNLQKRAKADTKIYCNYCNAHISAANSFGTGICIRNADTYWNFADANAAKTWLTQKNAEGKPFYYQYETAEEEWVPLSAEEQAAMNALCTYAGTTHIWTDDPLQPVISLDYTVDTEGYIKDTTPAYRDVERFALTGEASGTVATCTDSAEWPLLGVGMKGKCEQLTTTGKNLFGGKALADKIKEVAPSSTINADGTVTFSAPSIDGKLLYDNFESGKQYTVVLYGKNASAESISCNLKLEYEDGTSNALMFATKNALSYCAYTTVQNKTVVSLRGFWSTQSTVLHYDKCGIFEGAIDLSAFEPYTGAAPSPSPAYKQEIQETGTYNPETGMYEADMVMTGAQLFDQTTVTKKSYVNDVTGKIGSTAEDVNASDYISVMGYEYIKITSTMKTKQWGAFYDNNKTFLSGIVGYDKPIPVPPDASYARLTVIGDNLKTFMVNAGATALPWEPYKGVQTLPLTAGQPWRGIGDVHDEVCDRDGALGTWRRYTEDILDGSEDEAWRTTGCSEASHKRFYSNLVKTKAKPAGSNAKVEPILCTAYKAMTANDTYLQKQGISVEIDGTIAVYDDGFSPDADVNGFKARLAEYPITVVYQLKEPYFEPFPDEIQKQYRKLKSYAGTTHAWVDDPLQPEVSFKYVKDSKLVLGKLEDRLAALEAGQAQTAAAFSYLPPEIQAEMIETETRELMNSI
ncbi:hypothetical protein [Blautia marasmi]|uniref:hypothetical protein n=1 Tax=Blautia marasmi TaxID=1917868 RepID=UPI00266C5047|nr:hypothetical protein [Blautia marasmi]